MMLTLMLMSLTLQDPPPVMTARAPSQTEIDWGFRLPAPEPVPPVTPSAGSVQACLATRFSDGSVTPDCRPVLEVERALVPAEALTAPSAWVGQTCARENLRPGQTTLDCRSTAQSRARRAITANDALEGRLPPPVARAAQAQVMTDPQQDPADPDLPESGFRRQCTQESRRDPDGRDSSVSSSCSVRWTSTTRR